MFAILFSLFSSIRQVIRSRAALQVEILALRHQLLVLRRANQDHRLRLNVADRLLWVWLSRLWSGWRSALLIVKPETVIAWHRRGFHFYWRWKSRHRQGRPSVSPEIIDLIRKMSLANPRWGAEFIRALELNPRNVLARSRYALWCLEVGGGRFDQSISQAKQALEEDPLSDYAATILAFAYYIAGRLTEARETAGRAMELEPESFLARVSLTFVLYAQGRHEEAVGVIEAGLASSGRHPMFMASLAATYAAWGMLEAAKSVHAELLARSSREYVSPFLLAVSASANRQSDEAIQFARKAYETRDPQLIVFGKHWIGTKLLLEDPRFAELLANIGLQ